MDWKRYAQISLLVFLIAAGVRLYLIYRERNAPTPARDTSADRVLSSDDYVVLPKSYVYDLNSAKSLRGKTAWARTTGQFTYYPAQGSHTDFSHGAGTVASLEPLRIEDFALQPNGKRGRQLVMLFTTPAHKGRFGVPVGVENNDQYVIYLDDAFLLKDPHEVYKHWTADDWKSIAEHRAVKGMSEAQAAMALGAGGTSNSDAPYGNRTLEYANGGNSISVTFTENKATQISGAK